MLSNNGEFHRSPRAVIDMRLFELDEGKLMHHLAHLRTPMTILAARSASIDAADKTEASLPPIDTLSVCCSSSADNDDSVSSVSLDEDTWSTSSSEKRVIFTAYWNKKGGMPKQSLRVSSASVNDDHDPKNGTSLSCSEGDQSYEHLLETNESPLVRRESHSTCGGCGGARRRLWDNHYVAQSEPSLLVHCLERAPLRKTQSAPAVEPRRSCLRKGRFAGNSSDTVSRRSSDATAATSVSFNAEIQVRYLKPVTENWAPRGWSKFFI